jgi:hypothetical protein
MTGHALWPALICSWLCGERKLRLTARPSIAADLWSLQPRGELDQRHELILNKIPTAIEDIYGTNLDRIHARALRIPHNPKLDQFD